jgi:molybdopterin-guanine dinucleotide biosynthesis protein A/rhodanese-related sulfurtransferase
VTVLFEGVVLTGGASRRFGSDKAMALIDGVPMVVRVVAALRAAGAESVATVGGSDRGVDVPHRSDLYPGDGPLGGLLTAFAHARTDVVMVAACDLPDLDGPTVRAVVAGMGTADAAVATTDRLEPLCAAYRVSACGPAFSAAFAAGERSLVRALERVTMVTVAVNDPRRVRNVNTPTDRATGLAFAAMSIPEISVDELAARLADGATVYDVREPDEWAEVRVPGAVLVPLGSVPDSLDAFPADGEVLLICRSGGRSMRACEWLATQGRTPVNVAGGTLAWVGAGFDTEAGTTTS